MNHTMTPAEARKPSVLVMIVVDSFCTCFGPLIDGGGAQRLMIRATVRAQLETSKGYFLGLGLNLGLDEYNVWLDKYEIEKEVLYR